MYLCIFIIQYHIVCVWCSFVDYQASSATSETESANSHCSSVSDYVESSASSDIDDNDADDDYLPNGCPSKSKYKKKELLKSSSPSKYIMNKYKKIKKEKEPKTSMKIVATTAGLQPQTVLKYDSTTGQLVTLPPSASTASLLRNITSHNANKPMYLIRAPRQLDYPTIDHSYAQSCVSNILEIPTTIPRATNIRLALPDVNPPEPVPAAPTEQLVNKHISGATKRKNSSKSPIVFSMNKGTGIAPKSSQFLTKLVGAVIKDVPGRKIRPKIVSEPNVVKVKTNIPAGTRTIVRTEFSKPYAAPLPVPVTKEIPVGTVTGTEHGEHLEGLVSVKKEIPATFDCSKDTFFDPSQPEINKVQPDKITGW